MKIKGIIYSEKSMQDLKTNIDNVIARMENIVKKQEDKENRSWARMFTDFIKKPKIYSKENKNG